MEKLQLLAMVQAYSSIGIGLMVGLGAMHAPIAPRPTIRPMPIDE